MNIESAKKEIVRIVKKHMPDVSAIYLFGSCRTGECLPDSDIDIAILLPFDSPSRKKINDLSLCHTFFKALGRDADIIDLQSVATVLQMEIISGGIRIFDNGTDSADKFEILTMSFYQKLTEEISDIVKSGLSGGRFYDI